MSFVLAFALLASARVLSPERPLTPAPRIENVYCDPFSAHPSIASDGKTTFAMWADYRRGTRADVFAARLDENARPIDANDLPIATRQDVADTNPSIVWDGRRFIVVWVAYNDGTMIGELRPDGTVTGATLVSDGFYGDPIVRPDGGVMLSTERRLLVVSADFQHVTEHALDFTAYNPHVARIRDGYIAIWLAGHLVMTQLIDPDGNPIGNPSKLASAGENNYYPPGTCAASRGDGALIAFYSSGTVNVFTVSPSGTIAPLTTDTGDLLVTMLATADGGFVLANTLHSELHRFDANGRLLDRMTLDQVGDFALANTDRGIVGCGTRGGVMQSFVYGDAESHPISFIPNIQTTARMASDGKDVLVLWREGDPISLANPVELLAQVAGSSAPPVHIAGNTEWLVLTSDATSYIAAWTTYDSTQRLRAQRLNRDGTPRSQAVGLGDDAFVDGLAAAGPVVAWLQDRILYWVSFDQRAVTGGAAPIQAWDVAAAWDGKSLMFALSGDYPESLVPGGSPVRIDDRFTRWVAIAGDGKRWFAAYSGDSGVYGRYLTYDGSPDGAPIRLSTSPYAQPLRAVWDGETFVVSWSDGSGVYLVRVSDETQTVSATPLREENCDLAVVDGNTVVAYERASPEANYTARIQLRTLMRPPRTRAVR